MRTCKRVGHVRAYMAAGSITHLVCVDDVPISEGGPAICGDWPETGDARWLGHSDKQEADVAKVLPLCRRCAVAVKLPAVM